MEGITASAPENIITRKKNRVMASQSIVNKTWGSSVSFPKGQHNKKIEKSCSKEVAAVQSEYIFLYPLNCD